MTTPAVFNPQGAVGILYGGGGLIHFGTLGGVGSIGRGAHDPGQIVGEAVANGVTHAVLLTPAG